MQKNFTSELLVKYLYHETTAAEKQAINQELISDFMLREKYTELAIAYRELPKVQFKPSRVSVQNILNYSKQTMLEEMA